MWPALTAVGTTLAMVMAIALIVVTSTLDVLTAGLPDPAMLESLTFAQPTIVYDREGKVELGRFQSERRRVVAFDEVPRLVLDATTTAEDRTFWENAGIDLAAIVSAVGDAAAGQGERGASTITQQLVRARLLPEDVVGQGADQYMRKAKEILQSLRLSDEFPGEAGKQRVMTAYLNEIFYGHQAYGIAAAAETYFGVRDLSTLTVSQAALLAGLPQSPTYLDPYRSAVSDADGRLVVPPGSPAMVRRDWILRGLLTVGRWTTLSTEELADALAEPVILAPERRDRVPGGQFTWQVRRQLQAIVGPDVDLETAGLRVITTLDWSAQRLAVKWLGAAAIAPNLTARKSKAMLDRAKIGTADRRWINDLRGKDLHNASLVALDYRTGDVLAYVGSAGYDRNDLARRQFEPKYDAAGDGTRQPGSAFKPIIMRRHSTVGCCHPAASSWTSRPNSIRARTGRRATPIHWIAGPCSCGERSSTRSTSRRSGPCSGSARRTSRTRPKPWASGSPAGENGSSTPDWPVRSGPSRSARWTSHRPMARSATAACTSRRG